jgi:hypothetical protein
VPMISSNALLSRSGWRLDWLSKKAPLEAVAYTAWLLKIASSVAEAAVDSAAGRLPP